MPQVVVKLSDDLQGLDLDQFAADREEHRNAAHVYKQCKARWVGRVDLPNQSIIMKKYRERSVLHQAKQAVRQSRASRIGQHALRMLDAGFSLSTPLACFEERWGPFRGNSCLLLRFIPGDLLGEPRALLRSLAAVFPEREPVNVVVEQLRGVRHRLLKHGLQHHDVHGANFLFDKAGKLQLLDIESIRPAWIRSRSAKIVNAKFDALEAAAIWHLGQGNQASGQSKAA